MKKKMIWLFIIVYGIVLGYFNVCIGRTSFLYGCVFLALINAFLIFLIRKEDSIIKKFTIWLVELLLGLILAKIFSWVIFLTIMILA